MKFPKSRKLNQIDCYRTKNLYISINSLVVKDVSGAVGTYDISINNGKARIWMMRAGVYLLWVPAEVAKSDDTGNGKRNVFLHFSTPHLGVHNVIIH